MLRYSLPRRRKIIIASLLFIVLSIWMSTVTWIRPAQDDGDPTRIESQPQQDSPEEPRQGPEILASTSAEPPRALAASALDAKTETGVTGQARRGPLIQAIRCVDDHGRAVPGCTIEAAPARGENTVTRELADSTGRATLTLHPSSSREFSFRGTAENGSSSGTVIHLVQPEEPAELELVLTPRLVLRGKVLDEQGTPCAGATVSCRLPGRVFGGATPVFDAVVTSDQGGVFGVACDAVASVVELVASHGLSASRAHRVEIPRDALVWINLDLTGPECLLSGTVVDHLGQSVSGARVELRRQDSLAEVSPQVTRPSGEFEFGLVGASYEVLATTQTAMSAIGRVELTSRAPVARVTLVLEQAAIISGQVVDREGHALGAVPVIASPDVPSATGMSPFSSLSSTVAESEATTGRFILERLIPGVSYELWCYPDPSRPNNPVVEHGVASGTRDLVIVVDEKRVRGAAVFGRVSVNGKMAQDGELEVFLKRRRPGREWSGGPTQRLQIVGGEYLLSGLVPGDEYFMEVWRPGCARQCHGPWLAGSEDERADFDYGRDVAVAITIRHADGLPALGWFAKLEEVAGMPLTLVGGTTKGPEGKASIWPVAPGSYSVTVLNRHIVEGTFELVVRAGGTNDVTFELPAR